MNARKLVAIALLLLGVALASAGQPPADAVRVRIARVVDGDTAVLLHSHEYVRYLGINTPEIGEPFYAAASRINRHLVLFRDVYLEFGPQRRDGYGRLLAYLWIQKDGKWIMVNEELLRRGVARLLVLWPEEEKYYDRFLRAVALAQVEKRGLWGKFKDPISLATLEADPVAYLTEAVTVLFTAGRVEEGEQGWAVYAAGSRFNFHVLVRPEVWEELGLDPRALIGRELQVTGQLRWERLAEGPYIEVIIPEQWGSG
jgi:micrococcal nuclease